MPQLTLYPVINANSLAPCHANLTSFFFFFLSDKIEVNYKLNKMEEKQTSLLSVVAWVDAVLGGFCSCRCYCFIGCCCQTTNLLSSLSCHIPLLTLPVWLVGALKSDGNVARNSTFCPQQIHPLLNPVAVPAVPSSRGSSPGVSRGRPLSPEPNTCAMF